MLPNRLRKVVHPLILLWYLLLRQKIRRPDEGEISQCNLGNAAGHCGILRHSRNKLVHLVLPKGILLGERIVPRKADSEFDHERGGKHVRPSDDGALSLKHLAS